MSCTQPCYKVALIAEAPAATLDTVYAELLPLARAYGFADLFLSQQRNERGHRFTASAVRSDKSVTMLAFLYEAQNPAELLAVATDRLLNLACPPCASL